MVIFLLHPPVYLTISRRFKGQRASRDCRTLNIFRFVTFCKGHSWRNWGFYGYPLHHLQQTRLEPYLKWFDDDTIHGVQGATLLRSKDCRPYAKGIFMVIWPPNSLGHSPHFTTTAGIWLCSVILTENHLFFLIKDKNGEKKINKPDEKRKKEAHTTSKTAALHYKNCVQKKHIFKDHEQCGFLWGSSCHRYSNDPPQTTFAVFGRSPFEVRVAPLHRGPRSHYTIVSANLGSRSHVLRSRSQSASCSPQGHTV